MSKEIEICIVPGCRVVHKWATPIMTRPHYHGFDEDGYLGTWSNGKPAIYHPTICAVHLGTEALGDDHGNRLNPRAAFRHCRIMMEDKWRVPGRFNAGLKVRVDSDVTTLLSYLNDVTFEVLRSAFTLTAGRLPDRVTHHSVLHTFADHDSGYTREAVSFIPALRGIGRYTQKGLS